MKIEPGPSHECSHYDPAWAGRVGVMPACPVCAPAAHGPRRHDGPARAAARSPRPRAATRVTACLILAAGCGSRMREAGDSKPLLTVAGRPLIEHAVLNAAKAGLTRFHVATGHQAPRVEAFLAALAHERGLAITPVRAEGWEAGNAASLLAARERLREPFALLMADHIFQPSLLAGLLRAPLEGAGAVLATDRRLEDNPLVEVDEATKVRTRDGRIVAIGKELAEYDGFDTGAFLCTPAIFAAAEAAARAGEATLSAAIQHLAAEGRARAHTIREGTWIDVDTPADRAVAEELLAAGC